MALFASASDPNWEFINEVRVRLVEAGVPEGYFTEKLLLENFITKKVFAKLLGPFRQADDRVKCESLLGIGIKHHYFDTIAGCTQYQFLKFLTFLRTPTGQDAIAQQARYLKLQRKGEGEFSAEEVALLSLAQSQQADLAKETTEFKRKIEAQILEHNKIIEDLHSQLENGVEEIKRSYLPIGVMLDLEPDEPLFVEKCWHKMELDSHRNGHPTPPTTVESLNKVVEVFGESVRKRMLIDFLNEGDSKEQLMNYAGNMLRKYEHQYDMTASKRFRSLLHVVGGEQAVQAPGLVQDPATRAGDGAQASKATPQVTGGGRKVPSTAGERDTKN